MQVRNYYDIAGSVRQILKDLDLSTLNLLLLPADGSMETIRVSAPHVDMWIHVCTAEMLVAAYFTSVLAVSCWQLAGIQG